MMKNEVTPSVDAYDAPIIGQAIMLASVTLFSGAINPDAGVVDFGDG